MKHLLRLLEIHEKETPEKRKLAIEKYIKDQFKEDLKAVRDVIELAEFQKILLSLYQSIGQKVIPFPIAVKITQRFSFKKKEDHQFIKLDPDNIPADINPSEIVSSGQNKYWAKNELQIIAPSVHSIMPYNPLTQMLLNLTPRDLLQFSSVNHYYSKFINSNFWKSLYKKYGFAGECNGKVDFLREYKKLFPKGTPLFMEDLWHAIAVGNYKGFNSLFNNEHIKEYILDSEGLVATLDQRLQEKCTACLSECLRLLTLRPNTIQEQYFIDLQNLENAIQEQLKIAKALYNYTQSAEIDYKITMIGKIAALYGAIANNDSKKFLLMANEAGLQSFLNSNPMIILALKKPLLARYRHCLFEYWNSLDLETDDPQREFFKLMEHCLSELEKTDVPLSLLALSYELIVKITDKTISPLDKIIAIRRFESEIQPWWKTCGKVLATMVIAATGIALGAAIGVALVMGGAWLLGAGLTLGTIFDLFAAGAVTTLTTSLTAGAGLSGVTAGTLSAFWLFKKTPEQTLAKNAKLISEITHQKLILA